MKNVITLSNHLFLWLWKSYLAKILVVSAILQPLLLWIKIDIRSGFDYKDAFLPYERILFDSGVTTLLLYGFLFIFAVILFHGINLRRNHKPIYTILTLPMPREQVYIAFWLSGLACVLTFLAFHALCLMLWYVPVTSAVNADSMQVILNLDNGENFVGMSNKIHNGLFLAFIRDPILQTMYPFTLRGLCNIVAIALILLSLCYVSIFSIKKSKWTIGYIILNVLWYYWIVMAMIRSFTGLRVTVFFLATTWGFALFVIAMTIFGIQAIKRGEGRDGK